MKRRSILSDLVLGFFVFGFQVTLAQVPSLHLAFENSLTADDGETPVSLNAVSFEDGIVGLAGHFGDSVDLLYSAQDEISGQQGALEFWIKPSWNGGSGSGNWVMSYGGGGGMLVGSDGVTWRIILNRYGANGLPELGVAVGIDDWIAGDWHHAVFNWNPERLELFVDGRLLDSQVPAVAPPAITATHFQIGADGPSGFLNGSLDEFSIYPQSLTVQQIEAGFCAGIELDSIDLHTDVVSLLTTWREQAVLTAVTSMGEKSLPGSCIEWESSDAAVASVDESGLIRAVAPGQTDISASVRGLQTQMQVNVSAPVRLPEEETIDAYLAAPATGALWEIPVVILRYLPTTDGVNVDQETTGYYGDLSTLKNQIDVFTNRVKFMLEEGSRFRGYKDSSARPSVGYRVIDVITVFEEFQKGFEVAWNPGWYRPDFNQILERFDGRQYVEDLGVKEFWIWGYHFAGLEPTESNMSSPLTGDVSNSLRYNDDMPIYTKTYTVYNYNFTRTQAEAVHNHEHQLESILSHANWLQDGDADLFWDEFSGRDDQGAAVTGRCGNAHMPPNTTTHYDYQNFTVVLSDCEDWKPGGGQQKEVSALTWQNLSYDWPDDHYIPQKTESQYYIYWMQNMPGAENGIPYGSLGMTNWWFFTADWDAAIKSGYGLYGEVPPPNLIFESGFEGAVLD